MEKRRRITIWAGSGSLAAFALWTWAVCRIGVQPIDPNGSRVGFGEMNHWFHQLTGVHMGLYTVTDWMGLVPVCFVLGFGLLGLVQLIRRRSLRQTPARPAAMRRFFYIIHSMFRSSPVSLQVAPFLFGFIIAQTCLRLQGHLILTAPGSYGQAPWLPRSEAAPFA